jgi:serine phosphatase RsbU (regulator of sigma subunit)
MKGFSDIKLDGSYGIRTAIDIQLEQILDERITDLRGYVWSGAVYDIPAILQELTEIEQKCRALGYNKGLNRVLLVKAFYNFIDDIYQTSLECSYEAQRVAENIGDLEGVAYSHFQMGLVFANSGESNRALGHYLKVLSLLDDLGMQNLMYGRCLNSIGVVHFDKKEYETAISYHLRAIEVIGEPNSAEARFGLALCINHIGSVYMALNELDKAYGYLRQAESLIHPGNDFGFSRVYNDIGRIYFLKGEYEAAFDYYFKSFALRCKMDYVVGLITTMLNIGTLYLKVEQDTMGLTFYLLAQDLAIQSGSKSKQATVYKHLYQYYEDAGNIQQAFHYHKLFHNTEHQVIMEDTLNLRESLHALYEIEKSAREKEIYRLRNEELSAMNEELGKALNVINDSIRYAQRIQHVILPSIAELEAVFSDIFVFYRPRDIVSGDFYWLGQNDECVLLAAIDCTGHGVPGAFMSIFGYSLLNQVIVNNKIYDPLTILHEMDRMLTKLLHQNVVDSSLHDGMDIALVQVHYPSNLLTIAGANLPLYAVLSGEFIEFPGSRYPLGGSKRIYATKQFDSQTIEFNPGDTIYLFSDGFKDQFGLQGEQRRKFSSKRFRTLIQSMQHLPLHQQAEQLEIAFEEWRGQMKQVDDVIVVGARL